MNFPTNQKCLSYFNLIWSFVVILVIARGSTYSLSKFSRLRYKSLKSSDRNAHSVRHVKGGNTNVTPQGEMSTAGPGRPASTTDSGNLRNSLEPGQNPHWPRMLWPESWPRVLLGEATDGSDHSKPESLKHLERIQTLRRWHGWVAITGLREGV